MKLTKLEKEHLLSAEATLLSVQKQMPAHKVSVKTDYVIGVVLSLIDNAIDEVQRELIE